MKLDRRLRNLMLAGFGGLALLLVLGGGNLFPASLTASPEVKKFAETSLVSLDDAGLEKILSENTGKPTLLFVYASWCPYCKQQFTTLNALQTGYPQEQLTIVYSALDKDVYGLSQFLMERYPQQPFTPYHVPAPAREAFDTKLTSYGFTPDGGIPHLFLFDAKGKPLQEFKGLTPLRDLQEALEGKI